MHAPKMLGRCRHALGSYPQAHVRAVLTISWTRGVRVVPLCTLYCTLYCPLYCTLLACRRARPPQNPRGSRLHAPGLQRHVASPLDTGLASLDRLRALPLPLPLPLHVPAPLPRAVYKVARIGLRHAVVNAGDKVYNFIATRRLWFWPNMHVEGRVGVRQLFGVTAKDDLRATGHKMSKPPTSISTRQFAQPARPSAESMLGLRHGCPESAAAPSAGLLPPCSDQPWTETCLQANRCTGVRRCTRRCSGCLHAGLSFFCVRPCVQQTLPCLFSRSGVVPRVRRLCRWCRRWPTRVPHSRSC